jgi:hypothetical protein
MSRADLTALIERVEAATGPDRELDAEIARTRLPADADDIARSRGGWSYRVFGPEGWDDEWMEVRPYTGSLNAAATLASNWIIVALDDMVADGANVACAGAVLLISTDPIKHASGIGYGTRESGCLARALTAAALRARLASMGDDA